MAEDRDFIAAGADGDIAGRERAIYRLSEFGDLDVRAKIVRCVVI